MRAKPVDDSPPPVAEFRTPAAPSKPPLLRVDSDVGSIGKSTFKTGEAKRAVIESFKAIQESGKSKGQKIIGKLFSLIVGKPSTTSKPKVAEAPTTLTGYLSATGDLGKKTQIDQLIALGQKAIAFFSSDEVTGTVYEHLSLPKTADSGKTIAAALTWALMDAAIKKEQAFTEGSFIVEDKNNRIFDFLNSVDGAYKRRSSHLQGFDGGAKLQKKHGGLDIPPTGERKLHANMAHLLFASIEIEKGKRHIFIRAETHGMKGAAAVAGHSYGFYQSVGRKVLPSVFGSNQGAGKRKERIPPKLVKEFETLLRDKTNFSEEDKNKILADVRKFGIGKMYDFARIQMWQDFVHKLGNKYDHVASRIGEEVFFSADDLSKIKP